MAALDINPKIGFRLGERLYGTNSDEKLHNWVLKGGARFVSHGNEHKIEVPGKAEAVWARAEATDYTLVFSFQSKRGTVTLSLQRSGEREERSEYCLQLTTASIALERFSCGETQELGSASIQLSPGCWYTACVESCNGWKRVTIDNDQVLKIEDPQPLPAGSFVFCSMENDKTVYAGVHITPWAGNDANRIREILERYNSSFKPVEKWRQAKSQLRQKTQVVTLETAVFRYVYGGPHVYDRKPAQINPGNIPPNFAHTWILDLKGIEAFRLHLASFEDIKLHKDDRVSIYNLQGLKSNPPKPLTSFSVFATAAEMTVDLSTAPYDKVRTGPDYKRVYIQLETSSEYVPRRFIISGLEIDDQTTGDEEALLFNDDINYSSVIIAVEQNKQGIPNKIPAPWVPGWYTHYNNIALPDSTQGWYLTAKYFTSPDQSFYAMVYYNEQKSLLRLYLYNLDMPMNVTGATVTVSLERFTPAPKDSPYPGRCPLSGALFSLHPNPNRWSSAEIPLPYWGPGTWTCVEVPILYPMAENIPVDLSKAAPLPPTVHYRSLYEEPLQKGLRGILLKLHIDTYDFGEFDGTLTGQAVGEAIEALSQQPGFFDTLKAAGGAVGDIFKNGYAVYKGIKDFYDKVVANPPNDMSTFKFLSSVVEMGASTFSGVGSMVSAAVSFVSTIFGGEPKLPLRMSIMLDLNAKLKGQLKIQHNLGPSVAFYFPGRFAIDEAVNLGLLVDDPDVTDRWAPRYDRTMGLFGYRYEPSEVIFPLLRGEGHDFPSARLSVAFPTHPFSTVKYDGFKMTPPLRDDIERLLPIVYNSFAEITPMKPIVEKTEISPWPYPIAICQPGEEWILKMQILDWGLVLAKWYFDVAWKTHVVPEPDDTKFPPDGFTKDSEHGPNLSVRVRFHDNARAVAENTIYFYGAFKYDPNGLLIQISPALECLPHTYKDFKDVKYVKVIQKYYYTNVLECEDEKGNWISIMDVKDLYPFDNAVYFWDIPYFYYGRTRKVNGVVPSLRWTAQMCCPVMLHITTSRRFYDNNTKSWNEQKKYQLIPSKLLE
jgi:hypothetical protein